MNIRGNTSVPNCLGLSAKSGLFSSKSVLFEVGLFIYFDKWLSRNLTSVFNPPPIGTCVPSTLTSLGVVFLFALCPSAGLKPYTLVFYLHSFDY